ncbi:hypothetical protein F4703DRAFT_1097555 [Phycomyces blakesleeanus]
MHSTSIIRSIIKFMKKSHPEYRLSGFYVINAISRMAAKMARKDPSRREGLENYLKSFSILFRNDVFKGAFSNCTTTEKTGCDY